MGGCPIATFFMMTRPTWNFVVWCTGTSNLWFCFTLYLTEFNWSPFNEILYPQWWSRWICGEQISVRSISCWQKFQRENMFLSQRICFTQVWFERRGPLLNSGVQLTHELWYWDDWFAVINLDIFQVAIENLVMLILWCFDDKWK